MSEDTICEECGDLYSLRDGCEPSKYCDECAQDVVIRIARELTAAIERAEKAEHELVEAKADAESWRQQSEMHMQTSLAQAERAEKAEKERDRWIEIATKLVNHCDKESGECSICSEIVCPHGDPMHFHHDGCPTCVSMERGIKSNE